MKIGILGAGSIASKMAETFSKMKNAEIYAVSWRSISKEENFAKKYKIKKAFGSYEEMIKDENVELIYIATPHSHHFEHAKLCLENKKPVLCEKSFTMNSAQAKELVELSKKQNTYLAEAIWTRYMPSRKLIDDVISSGIIGKINVLTANLSYNIKSKERLIKPELAGGALLDVGVYGLNFTFMHFGTEIQKIDTSVKMTETGVDETDSVTIHFKDGKSAFITAGINSRSDRKGIFWGENGYIIVENINNPNLIKVFNSNDKLIKKIKIPRQITGYEYEVAEAIEQIQQNKTESISMPLSETLFVMEIMDSLRKQWGLIYPQEL